MCATARIVRALRWAGVVLACAAVVFLIVTLHAIIRANQAAQVEDDIRGLAREVICETLLMRPEILDLPRGDVRSLFEWLRPLPRGPGVLRPEGWRDMIDTEMRTFRDLWGHELVYRFPSRREGAIIDLYSVGPNGKDEAGKGDDVSCERCTEFNSFRVIFKGGEVVPAWVWANLGRLERTRHGEVVGAPPSD